MGCNQSRVEEQVVAPATDAAAPEVAAPVEATPAVEVAPASTTAPVEEAKPEAEAPAAEAEAAAPAAVEPPTESAVSTEAVASETPAEVLEVTEAAVPAAEPVAEEPAEAPAAEPEAETVPATEEAAPEPSVSFVAAGTVVDQNVVFYQFTVVDKEDPAKETKISKRFNDFKTLHAEVAKLLANESNEGAALPPLPKSGVTTVLFGRKNKNLTADREEQFAKILNAIASHPNAFESDVVKSFLA